MPLHQVGGEAAPGRLGAVDLDEQIGISLVDVAVDFLEAPALAFLLEDVAHLVGQIAKRVVVRAKQLDLDRFAGAGEIAQLVGHDLGQIDSELMLREAVLDLVLDLVHDFPQRPAAIFVAQVFLQSLLA